MLSLRAIGAADPVGHTDAARSAGAAVSRPDRSPVLSLRAIGAADPVGHTDAARSAGAAVAAKAGIAATLAGPAVTAVAAGAAVTAGGAAGVACAARRFPIQPLLPLADGSIR